jgi:hypothetical protein
MAAPSSLVIVLIGIPGSGKSTLANEFMSRSPPGLAWINQDTLGDRKACERAFATALKSGRSVILDRCNFDSRQRSTWVRMARESRQPARLIAVQLLLDLHLCIQRVQARTNHPTLDGKTGERVCHQFFNDFEMVRRDEGFDELLTARNPLDVTTILDILVKQVHLLPPRPEHQPPPAPLRDYSNLFADPKQGPYDLDSSATILLFDLNGTLTSLTDQRRSKGTKLRPGIERLKELKDAGYRLGIYTSAMTRTAKESSDMISAACGCDVFDPGLILHRDHTRPCPPPTEPEVESEDPSNKRKRQNHDTIKPLAPYFSKMNQVILFDDDAHKSCEGEERNLCLVPKWESDEDTSCTTLSFLVDSILGSGIIREADVRDHTEAIRERIHRGAGGAGTLA